MTVLLDPGVQRPYRIIYFDKDSFPKFKYRQHWKISKIRNLAGPMVDAKRQRMARRAQKEMRSRSVSNFHVLWLPMFYASY